MNQYLVELLGAMLIHMFWLGILIGMVSFVVLRVVSGRASASVRHLLLLAALVAQVLTIPLAFALVNNSNEPSALRIEVREELPGVASVVEQELPTQTGFSADKSQEYVAIAERGHVTGSALIEDRALAPVNSTLTRTTGTAKQSWISQLSPWIVGIYLIGVLVMLARLVRSLVGVREITREASPVKENLLQEMVKRQCKKLKLKWSPVVAASAHVVSPVLVGLMRPVILIPANVLTGLRPCDIEMIIAHELAHLKRWDNWFLVLQRLIEVVFFFSPTTWYLSRELSRTREVACDQMVVAAGHSEFEYAQCLFRVAEHTAVAPSSLGLAVVGESNADFLVRIRLLLGEEQKRQPIANCLRWNYSIGILLAVALALTVAPKTTAFLSVSQEESVEIQFPKDRAVGQLWTRVPSEFDYDKWYPGLFSGGGNGAPTNDDLPPEAWKRSGLAHGTLEFKKGLDIRLEINNIAATDLSFLENIDPNALHSISLRDSNVGDESIAALGQLSGLKELDLSSCCLTDKCAPHFRGLRNLRAITISSYQTIDKGFGIGDGTIEELARLPHLEELVADFTRVTDKGLKVLANRDSLRRLSLRNTEISDDGIAALSNLKLEALYVGSTGGMRRIEDLPRVITDRSLAAIGTLSELRQLLLTGTHTSDEGLKQIGGLSKLQSLTLDQTLVTNKGIQQLGGMKELTILRREGSFKLNNDSLRALQGCKKLKRFIGRIDYDQKTLDLLVNLPSLEDLRIAGELVTNDELKKLGKLKNLKTLSLSQCPVDDEGLAHLAILKNLNTVILSGTQVKGHGFASLKHLPITWVGFNSPKPEEIDLSGIAQIKTLSSIQIMPGQAKITGVKALASSPNLMSFMGQGLHLNREQVEAFSQNRSVQWMFAGLNIKDEDMHLIGSMTNLRRMSLSGNFTDEGLKYLSGCQKLEYLSIRSSETSKEGLARLTAQLPRAYHSGTSRVEMSSVSDRDEILRYGTKAMRRFPDSLEGKPPYPLKLTSIVNARKELEWNELRGKVVLVDFWGTWCGPCVQAMPELQRLHEKYNADGFEIISVHTTAGSEKFQAFVDQHQFGWVFGIDKENQMVENMKPSAYPSYTLIDRKGILRVSEIHSDDLEKAISWLIDEQ